MNRFDRILGILLMMRSGRSVSAAGLAERFGVSMRTIYRDMETLSALGVPIYAERGREGGFRLLEGYFLPPLMLSTGEAVSLLLGITLLRSLRARPYPAEIDTAEKKLLAAVPDRLRAVLIEAPNLIGFESQPGDVFHPEPESLAPAEPDEVIESELIGVFLQAILERRTARLRYRSPYRSRIDDDIVEPLGLFWDRGRWYLAGRLADRARAQKLWRADRVLELKLHGRAPATPDFDVRELLNRNWLASAMARWSRSAPVKIRLTIRQAERLQRDWYYRHAAFEAVADDRVTMTFGESDRQTVMELMRWLGPDAELIEPREWRKTLRAELSQMSARYAGDEE